MFGRKIRHGDEHEARRAEAGRVVLRERAEGPGFEGIGSERGIGWRMADSFSLPKGLADLKRKIVLA
jgi:hypothetical protein